MRTFGYLVLLLLAFMLGLAGTVAASQALVPSATHGNAPVRAVDNDTSLPRHLPMLPDHPTVEC